MLRRLIASLAFCLTVFIVAHPVKLIGATPPSIATQPASETVLLGNPAALAVTATVITFYFRTHFNFSPPGNVQSATPMVNDNVLAVEVHQTSATSSDVIWGMSMSANVASRVPDTLAPILVDRFPVANSGPRDQPDLPVGHAPGAMMGALRPVGPAFQPGMTIS